MQTLGDDGALGTVGRPVVAASSKGEECHGSTAHLVHGVETVGDQVQIGVLFGQVLCVETAHRHGTYFDAETVGGALEHLSLLRVAQHVVKGLAVAQSAHVKFDTVAAKLLGQVKFSEFLAFENHPVANTHLIALLRYGCIWHQTAKWQQPRQ